MKFKKYATRLLVTVIFGYVWQRMGAKLARKVVRKVGDE